LGVDLGVRQSRIGPLVYGDFHSTLYDISNEYLNFDFGWMV
jgi:hypothetical protein